jgi:hypothetical protein
LEVNAILTAARYFGPVRITFDEKEARMIVWRGYGILVAVFAVVGLLIGRLVAEQIWGAPMSEASRHGSALFGMLIAAGGVYGLHRVLERREPPRTLVDAATGQQVQFKSKHDFFFIPVKFWPFLLAALGVWYFFKK